MLIASSLSLGRAYKRACPVVSARNRRSMSCAAERKPSAPSGKPTSNGKDIRRGRRVVVRASDGRPPDYWWLKDEKNPEATPESPETRPRSREPLTDDDADTSGATATRISIWDTKPFWCQPWSIVFTGGGAVGMSWDLLHWPWLTATLAGVIVVWWFLFLVVNPRLFDQYIEEAEREGRNWMDELDLKPDIRQKLEAGRAARQERGGGGL